MQKNFPILIRRLEQEDSFNFIIEWSDGLVGRYRLSDLQNRCSCARCVNGPKAVQLDVRAAHIFSVGRYALRIQYTSGCSAGIYSFDMLYQLITKADS